MNKKKAQKDSLFQKKGFYVALYSCVAVLLVAAVAISYDTLNQAGKAGGQAESFNTPTPSQSQPRVSENSGSPQVVQGDLNEILQNSSGSRPSLPEAESAKTNQGSLPSNAPATVNNDQKPQVEPVLPQAQAESQAQAQPPAPETALQEQEAAPVMSQWTTPISQLAEEAPQSAKEPEREAEAAQTQENEPAPNAAIDTGSATVVYSQDEGGQVLADPVFNAYDGERDMEWPVSGDIVMNFSTDKLIYDLTLNQYRTNDTICISAVKGDRVRSAADGVVKSIERNSREFGNSIVIEHGNGWRTTYSQLQDDIFVAVGDVVEAGQEIGKVGDPSIYSTLLGQHLSFKVTKDSEAINPIMILAQ